MDTGSQRARTTDSRVVHAEGLCKSYVLGETSTLVSRMRRRSTVARSDFLAVHNVSFELHRGECFGLVGGNGSGKSTVLQILAGITLPTSGSMAIRGLVLPLLAVGSGFHPELTGRENTILFGTVLGLERQVVEERMDEIIAFAELEGHIDTPNKRYSDGMQARLSFAIAMVFPADIYVFDEVLAVVDGEFRERCLTEIRKLVDARKAVMFVSHDADQVSALCDRAMWLNKGECQAQGAPGPVLDAYRRAST